MRRLILLVVTMVALLAAHPLVAGRMTDSVERQLRAQGYSGIKVSSTLLGRTRITAKGHGTQREIVINPRTGEILRDYSYKPGPYMPRAFGKILNPFAGFTGSDDGSGSASASSADGGSGSGGDSGGDGGGDGGGGGGGDGGD